MSEPSEFANILTTLYSRKMNRANFNRIREEYKEKTGKDLCTLIREAKAGVIKDIEGLQPRELGGKLRTPLFKLADYSTWESYCPIVRIKK